MIAAAAAWTTAAAPAEPIRGTASAELQTESGETAGETFGIPEEMAAFLEAWKNNDELVGVEFFSDTDTARRIRRCLHRGTTGYDGPRDRRLAEWRFINRVWRCRTREGTPPNAAVAATCTEDGRGPYIPMIFEELDQTAADDPSDAIDGARTAAEPGGRFIVVEANEALMSIFMDGETSTMLRSGDGPVLAMIAGVMNRTGVPDAGPFAAFWAKDPEGWRIATIGLLER